jgi:bifunctional oligoribonuclease and PAP phosphatase NrnA
MFDLIRNAQNPVFISDERVDGDSLGAALAMVDYVSQTKERPKVYVSEPVPEQYLFLPHVDVCTNDKSIFEDESIDLVVVFDCSDADYVESLVSKIPEYQTVINIDHHKTNPLYGDVNQVLADAPATADVVFRFFTENNIIPTQDSATCLLTGLAFDTNAFSNAATNERVFDTASKLILSGARVQDVIKTMYKNKSISALRVWGAALERLHDHEALGIVTTCLTRKDIEDNNATNDEIDGLSNFLSLVTDTDTLFVLRETEDGEVKVSMRSNKRDVSILAKAFFGGGHAKAAGFTIPNSKIECDDHGCYRVVRLNK